MELIKLSKGEVPLFGVCLGQQAIVLEAGGEVVRAPAAVHGKASVLEHDGSGPFEGVPNPIKIGRYHSLCTPNPPSRFRVHAAIDGMAMAISDTEARQMGVQFHPESVLTPVGQRILTNVLKAFN
jgi:anthranilate synthase/aminodeoxychorismate synthase-like glutamine amidotransferase